MNALSWSDLNRALSTVPVVLSTHILRLDVVHVKTRMGLERFVGNFDGIRILNDLQRNWLFRQNKTLQFLLRQEVG